MLTVNDSACFKDYNTKTILKQNKYNKTGKVVYPK